MSAIFGLSHKNKKRVTSLKASTAAPLREVDFHVFFLEGKKAQHRLERQFCSKIFQARSGNFSTAFKFGLSLLNFAAPHLGGISQPKQFHDAVQVRDWQCCDKGGM